MGIARLQERLGYTFCEPELLEQALTHRSVGMPNNERLEFLGDAVLSFLVADELFQRYHDATEGQLTRLRALHVRGRTLADISRELELGGFLRLGGGELKSGGRERESILADVLEAVLGAIYLDGGLQACRRVVEMLFQARIQAASPEQIKKDPKTRLQEWLQSRHMPLPKYTVLFVEGVDHDQSFTVRCEVEALGAVTEGRGASRRRAEQAAAEAALSHLVSPS